MARVDCEAFGPYRENAKECIRLQWAIRSHLALPDDVRQLWLAAVDPSWDEVSTSGRSTTSARPSTATSTTG